VSHHVAPVAGHVSEGDSSSPPDIRQTFSTGNWCKNSVSISAGALQCSELGLSIRS